MAGMRLAVVGASGAVGREMLRALAERRFPAGEIRAFATARSAGRRVPFGDAELTVEEYGDGALAGIDLALFSAGGAAARTIVPGAAEAGTVCVDNSSAFRLEPGVPLVVPEINGETLVGHRGIVANPNCTAITALMALAPLHRAFGLRSMVVSSYQSVSGTGMKGIRELAEQVEKLRGQEEMLGRPDRAALPAGEVFGKTIAFNVLARCDAFTDGGFTVEETKMRAESRRILGLPDLAVSATAVRVPVMVGHAVSAFARFDLEPGLDAARAAIEAFPGVALVDDPDGDAFPTPLDAAGADDVLVGRLRRAPDDRNALLLFSAADNLRKGAALNAVQIAERLVADGLLGGGFDVPAAR